MHITDVYPDRAYFENQNEKLSVENIIKRDASEAEFIRQLEGGNTAAAGGLVLDLIWDKDRHDELLKYCGILLAAPPIANEVQALAYYGLAALHIPNEEYDKAITLLEKGLRKFPLNEFLCSGLLHVYYHIEAYDKALQVVLEEYDDHYKKFYKDEGEHDPYFCEKIGLCYFMKKEYHTALTWFGHSVDNHTDNKVGMAQQYNHIAMCWQNLNDIPRAWEAFQKAVKLTTEVPEAFNNITDFALLHPEYVPETIEALNRAHSKTEYHEFDMAIWENLSKLYLFINNPALAERAQREYLKSKRLCDPLFYDENDDDDDDDDDDYDAWDIIDLHFAVANAEDTLEEEEPDEEEEDDTLESV